MFIIRVTSSAVLLLRASSPSITPVICIVWFQTYMPGSVTQQWMGWMWCLASWNLQFNRGQISKVIIIQRARNLASGRLN